MSDLFKKYLTRDSSARIQATRLADSWQTGQAHQHYPDCVQRLLGQLVSAAVLLASNIKFDGSLVLQLQGDGPVSLIVVECTSELSIRATASLREGQDIPADGTLQSLLNSNGQGRFVVILDAANRAPGASPYQGIVPIEGDTVASALQAYMRDSEQLDTRLWLASDNEYSSGLLLQRLPDHGGHDNTDSTPDETWERITQLAATLKPEELLQLDTDTVIHRLFWQEDLIAFEPQPVRWHCPCTRERVANMLQALGQAEIKDILDENGKIAITCNFCGKPYEFDAVDCAALFVDDPGTMHNSDQSLH